MKPTCILALALCAATSLSVVAAEYTGTINVRWESPQPVFVGIERKFYAGEAITLRYGGDAVDVDHREWRERVCKILGFLDCSNEPRVAHAYVTAAQLPPMVVVTSGQSQITQPMSAPAGTVIMVPSTHDLTGPVVLRGAIGLQPGKRASAHGTYTVVASVDATQRLTLIQQYLQGGRRSESELLSPDLFDEHLRNQFSPQIATALLQHARTFHGGTNSAEREAILKLARGFDPSNRLITGDLATHFLETGAFVAAKKELRDLITASRAAGDHAGVGQGLVGLGRAIATEHAGLASGDLQQADALLSEGVSEYLKANRNLMAVGAIVDRARILTQVRSRESLKTAAALLKTARDLVPQEVTGMPWGASPADTSRLLAMLGQGGFQVVPLRTTGQRPPPRYAPAGASMIPLAAGDNGRLLVRSGRSLSWVDIGNAASPPQPFAGVELLHAVSGGSAVIGMGLDRRLIVLTSSGLPLYPDVQAQQFVSAYTMSRDGSTYAYTVVDTSKPPDHGTFVAVRKTDDPSWRVDFEAQGGVPLVLSSDGAYLLTRYMGTAGGSWNTDNTVAAETNELHWFLHKLQPGAPQRGVAVATPKTAASAAFTGDTSSLAFWSDEGSLNVVDRESLRLRLSVQVPTVPGYPPQMLARPDGSIVLVQPQKIILWPRNGPYEVFSGFGDVGLDENHHYPIVLFHNAQPYVFAPKVQMQFSRVAIPDAVVSASIAAGDINPGNAGTLCGSSLLWYAEPDGITVIKFDSGEKVKIPGSSFGDDGSMMAAIDVGSPSVWLLMRFNPQTGVTLERWRALAKQADIEFAVAPNEWVVPFMTFTGVELKPSLLIVPKIDQQGSSFPPPPPPGATATVKTVVFKNDGTVNTLSFEAPAGAAPVTFTADGGGVALFSSTPFGSTGPVIVRSGGDRVPVPPPPVQGLAFPPFILRAHLVPARDRMFLMEQLVMNNAQSTRARLLTLAGVPAECGACQHLTRSDPERNTIAEKLQALLARPAQAFPPQFVDGIVSPDLRRAAAVDGEQVTVYDLEAGTVVGEARFGLPLLLTPSALVVQTGPETFDVLKLRQ